MRVDWMLLAEGFGQDAKGAITAIGVNQSVLVAPSLPATTKRAVLVHVVDEEGAITPGGTLHFSFSVQSPSGRVLLAQSGQLAVGQKAWPDLPASLDIPAEFNLTAYEYGAHRVTAQLQLEGANGVESSVPLYVHEPIRLAQAVLTTDGSEPTGSAPSDHSSDNVETPR